jgi:hypothetical protein
MRWAAIVLTLLGVLALGILMVGVWIGPTPDDLLDPSDPEIRSARVSGSDGWYRFDEVDPLRGWHPDYDDSVLPELDRVARDHGGYSLEWHKLQTYASLVREADGERKHGSVAYYQHESGRRAGWWIESDW